MTGATAGSEKPHDVGDMTTDAGDMITHCVALGRRVFAERQFLLRSGDKVRYLSLPGWLQAAVVLMGVVVIGGIGGLAGAYHNLHKAIHRKEAEISDASARTAALVNLRQTLAEADDQYADMSQQLEDMKQQLGDANDQNEAMRDEIAAAEARVVALDKTRLALETRLHGAEQALTSKSGNLSELAKQLAQSRTEMQSAEQARAGLQKKLADLQINAANATGRADQLKATLSLRENELRTLSQNRDRMRAQIDQQTASVQPAVGYGSRLEQVIASTGLDLEKILGRLNTVPGNEGGPFIALDPRLASQQSNEREKQLEQLVETLPLSPPLAHYVLESPFGERIDPIRHRPAFHPGVDLSAPYGTPVLSTAPGVVTFTGAKDEYGKVVEISHGHGIVTRYAHLHRSLVALGQKVRAHQEIGELGSTGRSTGPHVHYEVLVDGVQLDPAKFLEAGKGVTQITAK
jgi:murein DD-endopeptidase MepM/ murein hydrolase activator NlpD